MWDIFFFYVEERLCNYTMAIILTQFLACTADILYQQKTIASDPYLHIS